MTELLFPPTLEELREWYYSNDKALDLYCSRTNQSATKDMCRKNLDNYIASHIIPGTSGCSRCGESLERWNWKGEDQQPVEHDRDDCIRHLRKAIDNMKSAFSRMGE